MKGHKFHSEDSQSYTIQHPNGTTFKIAKAPLSLAMHAQLAKLPKVQHDAEGSDDVELPTPQPTYSPGDPLTIQQVDPKALPMDITANSRPGDDEKAAAPDDAPTSNDAPVGDQTYPTPDGLPPAPPPAAPVGPDYNDQYLKDAGAAAAEAKQGNVDKANALGAQAEDDLRSANALADAQKGSEATYQAERQRLDTQNEQLYQQIANGNIDPNRVWSSASTGSKIAMLAGILISGAGANAGQGNGAMNVINKAIETDMEAQKANLNSKQSLLGYNLQRTRDLTAAQEETRLNLLATFKAQITANAAKQGGAIAKANALGLNAQIDQQMAGIKHQVAQTKAMMAFAMGSGPSQPGTDPDDIDPARVRQGLQLGAMGFPGGIPKEAAGDVRKELGLFQRQQATNSTLAQNFATMAQNVGGGPDMGPLTSNTRRKFDAAANVVASTVDHELAGRVTDTTLNELKAHNLPAWGDTPETLAEKQRVITDAIKAANSKDANGYGSLMTYGLMAPNNRHIAPSSVIQAQVRKR